MFVFFGRVNDNETTKRKRRSVKDTVIGPVRSAPNAEVNAFQNSLSCFRSYRFILNHNPAQGRFIILRKLGNQVANRPRKYRQRSSVSERGGGGGA